MAENLQEIKNKTVKGFFWRFGERISAQLVSFIVSVVLARILLPEDYGLIAMVTVFVSIADVFVTSGLSSALIQKQDADEIDFSTIFIASLLLSVILYVILFFLAPLIAKLYKSDLLIPVVRVMGLKLIVSAVNSVQQAFVSRKMIFKKFFFATLIGTIISGIVGVIMALNDYGVWALVAQVLTNPVIDTIILFITVKWYPKFLFSFSRFKTLFAFGWKIMFTQLFGVFFNKLRNLVIGAKYTSEDLAFYNRGESLPQLVSVNVISTLESVLFPAISKIQDNQGLVKSATRKSLSLCSFLLMPLMFGLMAIADNLIVILFTDKWIDAIPFMKIVCLAEMLDIFTACNLQTIKALGRSDITLKLEFVKKPIFLLIIIITAYLGVYYIAWGGVIYTLIALFINAVPNKKLINYTIFEQIKDVIPNLINSILMYVVVVLIGRIHNNLIFVLILQIVVGIMFYVFVCVITKNKDFYYVVNYIRKKGMDKDENKDRG